MLSKIRTCMANPKLALLYLVRKKYDWDESGNIKVRKYSSYAEYLDHQRKKLDNMGSGFIEGMEDFVGELLSRLKSVEESKECNISWSGKSVLCLGARLGHEVRAFNKLGCFAVGIDLNPGKDNSHVVHGDFHSLVWFDHCVDVIYTNSLDHSLYPNVVMDEIVRVLKPGGLLIMELNYGTDEGYKYGYFESVAWKKMDDILNMFRSAGFNMVCTRRLQIPFEGKMFVLRKK